MNLAINQPFLSSAFAVSMALHGIALVVTTNIFFASQNPILRATSPETPTLKTIEVSFKSISAKALSSSAKGTASREKQAVTVQSRLRKAMPVKAIHTPRTHKPVQPVTIAKAVSEAKKTKTAKLQVIKKLKPTAGKPDLSISKVSGQQTETSTKQAVSNHSKPLTAPPANYSEKKPFSADKPSYATNVLLHNKPSQTTGQLMATNLTHHGSGITSSLPPLLKSRQPDYPEEARWEERTGKAVIKFKISGQGSVLEPQISKSSGHRDLDKAAIRAIQFWRFKAKENQAANQWYQYSFRFELN